VVPGPPSAGGPVVIDGWHEAGAGSRTPGPPRRVCRGQADAGAVEVRSRPRGDRQVCRAGRGGGVGGGASAPGQAPAAHPVADLRSSQSRLPGQLTGSGGEAPYPRPSGARRRDSPQWFGGSPARGHGVVTTRRHPARLPPSGGGDDRPDAETVEALWSCDKPEAVELASWLVTVRVSFTPAVCRRRPAAATHGPTGNRSVLCAPRRRVRQGGGGSRDHAPGGRR
jgi:hypothetical protein